MMFCKISLCPIHVPILQESLKIIRTARQNPTFDQRLACTIIAIKATQAHLPTAYLAKSGLDLSYFRSNNPKQWSTLTSKTISTNNRITSMINQHITPFSQPSLAGYLWVGWKKTEQKPKMNLQGLIYVFSMRSG